MLLSMAGGCTLDPMLSDRLRDAAEPADADEPSDAASDANAPIPAARPTDVLPAPHGLLTVFGTSAEDVWVAGEEGALARFDGEGWHGFPTALGTPLRGLHGNGPSNVWAVGPHTVLRFDGQAWLELLHVPDETLLDIWVSPRGEASIAGHSNADDRALVRSWNGVEWQTFVLGTALTFWAVWGSSDGVIYIAGTALNGSGMVLRGNADGVGPSGYAGPSVRDVWGTSSDDVWVAAYDGILQHWDGSSWTVYEAPDRARIMGGIGAGSARAFAVGLDGLILHFDGQSWSTGASGTDKTLMSVWAAADDDAWAVGDATVLHWDGTEWLDTTL
jgi:hypothetical protein